MQCKQTSMDLLWGHHLHSDRMKVMLWWWGINNLDAKYFILALVFFPPSVYNSRFSTLQWVFFKASKFSSSEGIFFINTPQQSSASHSAVRLSSVCPKSLPEEANEAASSANSRHPDAHAANPNPAQTNQEQHRRRRGSLGGVRHPGRMGLTCNGEGKWSFNCSDRGGMALNKEPGNPYF